MAEAIPGRYRLTEKQASAMRAFIDDLHRYICATGKAEATDEYWKYVLEYGAALVNKYPGDITTGIVGGYCEGVENKLKRMEASR